MSGGASSKLLIPQLNLSFGLLGAVISTLALLSVLPNRSFPKKSGFLTGLLIGNLFSAGYSISMGLHRVLIGLDPNLYPNYTVWDCMKAPFMPTWALIGGQAPSLIVLMFGLERLSSLAVPTWHYHKWKPRCSWYAVAAVYIYVSVMVILLWITVGVINASDRTKPNRDCFLNAVLGLNFSTYYYLSQVFCGTAAMAGTVSALALGWCRLKFSHDNTQTKSRIQNQIRITKHMMALAVVDLFLVAVPNLILYFTSLAKYISFPSWANGGGSAAYSCNSSVNVVAYLIVNKQFRNAFLSFYKLHKFVKLSNVPFSTKPMGSVSPMPMPQGGTVQVQNYAVSTL